MDKEDQLGPKQAVVSGWITPKVMLWKTFIMLRPSCLCGCFLLFFAGWELIGVGIAIAICVLAYSVGPFPLAYNGLGDVCVVLFCGIIPVCFTYYVQALSFSLLSFLFSLPLGLLSASILTVNNYRDHEQDRTAHKQTTIVLLGRTFGLITYLLNGILTSLIMLPLLIGASPWPVCLFVAFSVLFATIRPGMRQYQDRELNRTLGHMARSIFIYAMLLSVVLLLSS